MPYCKRLSPSDDALAVFHAELARAVVSPEQAAAGPRLWPRFAGYYQGLARLPRRLRRQLQRQWRRSLGGLALLLALGHAPALAATINVDGTSCILVNAITAANIDEPTDGCTVGSGADTITLPANSTQTLTQTHNSTYGYTGLPVIRSEITIEGNGSTIMRAPGAPVFRIFVVTGPGNLTLNATTVSGGASFTCSRDFGECGGGIFVAVGGVIALTNSTVSGNGGYSGGGVDNRGTATLTSSTVSGNASVSAGGGVYNLGTLTLANSTVSGNSAEFGGGLNSFGNLILTNSTVSGNSADGGLSGGVDNRGTATLTNSTISGNSAETGGGVSNSGTVTLTSSTVSGNSAGFLGGGLLNRGSGTATLTNSTVSGNSAFYGGGVSNSA